MPVFDVPIVRLEVAEAFNRYLDGKYGLAPKVARPTVQPTFVHIVAGNKREAALLAEKFNPGWVAHPSNIMRARNA